MASTALIGSTTSTIGASSQRRPIRLAMADSNGYTENINIARHWRRRRVARALIVRSFGVLEAGTMTEAALGVHVHNPPALASYTRPWPTGRFNPGSPIAWPLYALPAD